MKFVIFNNNLTASQIEAKDKYEALTKYLGKVITARNMKKECIKANIVIKEIIKK